LSEILCGRFTFSGMMDIKLRFLDAFSELESCLKTVFPVIMDSVQLHNSGETEQGQGFSGIFPGKMIGNFKSIYIFLLLPFKILIFSLFLFSTAFTTIKCRNAKDSESAMDDSYKILRLKMVENQIERRGILNKKLLDVMREVPRHEFIPELLRIEAYEDHPVPIGGGQTISQPYIVAVMTARLEITENERVLEIGTGTGYQAAVLCGLAKEVYSIEIVEDLHLRAKEITKKLGIKNLHLRYGDGYRGWPEAAPFDAIILTAAPDHIPPELFNQLREGGRMILPVGLDMQELILVTKVNGKMNTKTLEYVRFVPMTGEAMGK